MDVAAIACSLVGATVCVGRCGSATLGGSGSSTHVGTGNATDVGSSSAAGARELEGGSLAGYSNQLRHGSGGIHHSAEDPPFIADVWLQGGKPVSDGPDSTTFKFAFKAGEMPTGRRQQTPATEP
jgi:hypothetical protein